jgi:hypothetical protein
MASLPGNNRFFTIIPFCLLQHIDPESKQIEVLFLHNHEEKIDRGKPLFLFVHVGEGGTRGMGIRGGGIWKVTGHMEGDV